VSIEPIEVDGRGYSRRRWRAWEHAWSWQVGWFRILGYGIAWVNHRKHPPLFTERYAGQHGIPKKPRLHIGHWCFRPTTWRHP
jgi:hypothetical protein